MLAPWAWFIRGDSTARRTLNKSTTVASSRGRGLVDDDALSRRSLADRRTPPSLYNFICRWTTQQLDAVEACRAHNPEVPGSKPGVAILLSSVPPSFLAHAYHRMCLTSLLIRRFH